PSFSQPATWGKPRASRKNAVARSKSFTVSTSRSSLVAMTPVKSLREASTARGRSVCIYEYSVSTTPNALDSPRGAQVLAAVADATVKLYSEVLAVQARVDIDAILTTVTSTISRHVPATCVAVQMKSDPDTSRVVFGDHTYPAMVRYLDEYVTALLRPGEA